jgi:hypothetical protein
MGLKNIIIIFSDRNIFLWWHQLLKNIRVAPTICQLVAFKELVLHSEEEGELPSHSAASTLLWKQRALTS